MHYSTGSNTGELREYGEALLPFDSWEDAGDYLGVMLPTPGIVADMHPLTSAIEPNDLESYYTARVRWPATPRATRSRQRKLRSNGLTQREC